MDQERNPPKQLTSADDRRPALLNGINDFYKSVESDQKRILPRAQTSYLVGTVLVLGSIVAAAVAGVTAIPSTGAWHWVAVGAAFVAALISAVNKSFDFAHGAQLKYQVYTQLWGILSELYRLKRNLDHMTYDAADQCLQELERRRREIGDLESTSGSLQRTH
jgi:hypothetical protein